MSDSMPQEKSNMDRVYDPDTGTWVWRPHKPTDLEQAHADIAALREQVRQKDVALRSAENTLHHLVVSKIPDGERPLIEQTWRTVTTALSISPTTSGPQMVMQEVCKLSRNTSWLRILWSTPKGTQKQT